ncbi:MAG: DegT/DnrJ/EryC1/StrS family aminotransferase [Planctomycetes bacterium]|nr:DegT/DnrJ/EryC1/StrS family aminotransferase [Planctomycetota bacterium]
MEKLAIEGGNPVRSTSLPPPYPGALVMDEKEKRALIEVIEHKSPFRYYGPNMLNKVSEFEKSLENYFQVNHALGLTSCTAALKTALVALGVGPGDEVIVPAYTFIACVSAVVAAKAIPVFVEVDETLNIDPKDLENKISAHTKVIMVVHLQGVSCDMDAILAIATEKNVTVLEDCAQSFGAEYRGRKVGTFGKISVFSLQMNKLITAGEGGFIITNNRETFLRAVRYHDHGNLREFEGGMPFLGENYRMSELAGALGVVQLEKLDDILAKMKYAKQKILDGIKDIKGITFRQITDGAEDIGTSVIFFVETEEIAVKFVDALNAENISTSQMYGGTVYGRNPQVFNMSTATADGCPFTCPHYQGKVKYYNGMCPKSESLAKRMIYIPLAPTFFEQEFADVIAGVHKVAAHIL